MSYVIQNDLTQLGEQNELVKMKQMPMEYEAPWDGDDGDEMVRLWLCQSERSPQTFWELYILLVVLVSDFNQNQTDQQVILNFSSDPQVQNKTKDI